MKYKHFTEEEVDGLDPELVHRLDWAREIAKVPFVLTSKYRPGDPRAHGDEDGDGDGEAVDIRAHDGYTRFRIVLGAICVGFNRIGVYDRHVHLDVSTRLPQQVLWVGESK